MIVELPDGVADQRGDRHEAVPRGGPQPRRVLVEISLAIRLHLVR